MRPCPFLTAWTTPQTMEAPASQPGGRDFTTGQVVRLGGHAPQNRRMCYPTDSPTQPRPGGRAPLAPKEAGPAGGPAAAKNLVTAGTPGAGRQAVTTSAQLSLMACVCASRCSGVAAIPAAPQARSWASLLCVKLRVTVATSPAMMAPPRPAPLLSG
jgi:hypothetical protein